MRRQAPTPRAILRYRSILWLAVGADSISARATSRNRPIARRGQDPSLRTNINTIQQPKPQPRKIPRGVEDAAPYGLHVSWRLPGAGRCKHRPLQSEGRDIRPRRGQCGKRKKSVKKNAALLHFLGFFSLTLLFGVPRGERLAAHNERRQFAAQTRSCGYSPRRGEHCSLPSFAALNCGPLLATPQSPRPGSAASEQRDFFRFLFWSQKRKVFRKKPSKMSAPPQGGGKRKRKTLKNFQKPLDLKPMFNATLVAETNQVRDTCHG